MNRRIGLLSALVSVVYVAYAIARGVTVGLDTSTYADWADTLIRYRFDYAAYRREVDFVTNPIFYVGWVTVVALSKVILADQWMWGVVLLNCLLVPTVALMVLLLVWRATRNAAAVTAVAILLCGAYEIFSWIPYVLSDFSFMVLVLAIFYLVAAGTWEGAGRVWRAPKIRCLVLVILIIASAIYRPTALPVVVFTGIALGVWRCKFVEAGARAGFARRAAVLATIVAAAAIALHARVMQDPSLWPASSYAQIINYRSLEYRAGLVVFDRPETYAERPETLSDFMGITVRKLAYFFAFSPQSYSSRHKLANVAFFVPVYGLALVAIVGLHRASHMQRDAWWTGWLALVLLVSFALFHALQQVDFDWRYRLPTLPPLLVLAGIGFGTVHESLRSRGCGVRL